MAQQIDSRRRIMPRSITAALVTLGLLVLAGLAIVYGVKAATDWLNPPPLKELAKHVLAQGVETPLPAEVATLFAIPNGGQPVIFHRVKAGSHDDRVHTIAARVRPETGRIDILIGDALPTGAGYHYLTTTDGRLVKAVYADTEMRNVPDAAERFATELKNWLEYLTNENAIND